MSKSISKQFAPAETYCSGCGACRSVCPKDAISICLTPAGFYEAEVNEDVCIQCGKCTRVCQRFTEPHRESILTSKLYALQSSDAEVVKASSSGGIAYEIAVQAIEEGQTVCGCIYDTTDQHARHIIASDRDDLLKMRGSKYLQSDCSQAFKELIIRARSNPEELFTVFGTPCQIAGLDLAARQIGVRDRFTMVEIFCHGVTSYKVWDQQLEKISSRLGGLPESLEFRYKKNDWHAYCIKAERCGKTWYGEREREDFWHVYFENVLLNDACMVCQSRKESSCADIRLGDYWGARYQHRKDGVSAVFAVTEAGRSVIKNLYQTNKLRVLKCGTAEEVLRAQNMAGYGDIKLHQEAISILAAANDAKKAVSYYRRHLSLRQQVKRRLLYTSSLIPAGLRLKLRRVRGDLYDRLNHSNSYL